jgi:DNA-directed RNA polymerase subunit H (RpoH/RPB5)
MKYALAMGLLIIFTASGCAPVASSVPKLGATRPNSKDSVIADGARKGDFEVVKKVRVVSQEKYEKLIQKLRAENELERLDETDPKLAELRELHAVKELTLPRANGRTNVIVIFVVKSPDKEMSDEAATALKIDCPRNKKNDFSFVISTEGESGQAWSAIKSSLVSVTLAYREAKKEE